MSKPLKESRPTQAVVEILPDQYTLDRRRELAEEFLDETLLPRALDGYPPEPDEIVALYHAFRQSLTGPGADFELMDTWHIAFQRQFANLWYRKHAPARLPADADELALLLAHLEVAVFGS